MAVDGGVGVGGVDVCGSGTLIPRYSLKNSNTPMIIDAPRAANAVCVVGAPRLSHAAIGTKTNATKVSSAC